MKRICGLTVMFVLLPQLLEAQGYTVKMETRFQSVRFRGVEQDSVAVADVVVDSRGSFATTDGFAVRCNTGALFCNYFRPGAERTAGPLVQGIRVSLWGLGIKGVDIQINSRLGADLADSTSWPGTSPGLQLLEGFARYSARSFSAKIGRLLDIGRLGLTGYDGIHLQYRSRGGVLRLGAYGGSGLADAVPLPFTSPTLNPLDDYQPRSRQLVVGGEGGLVVDQLSIGFSYRREVDRVTNKFVSERASGSLFAMLPGRVRFIASGDYDLSNGWIGSTDASLSVAVGRFLKTDIGVKRYRPYFDLRTIWGAFSPVPYRAAFGNFSVSRSFLRLTARGELYEFDNSETETPLADVEDDGWRWSVRLDGGIRENLDLMTNYAVEFGPGGASAGIDGAILFSPGDRIDLRIHGGRLLRPLEFRFDESRVLSLGVAASYRTVTGTSMHVGVTHSDEVRRRPDAAQLDWTQFRINVGLSFQFTSSSGLPSSILMIPRAPGQ